MLLTHNVVSIVPTYNITNHRKKATKTAENDILDIQSEKRQIFEETIELFESSCQAVSHFCCQSCQMTGITIKRSHKNAEICTMCQASHTSKEKMEKELPIWYDKDGIVQYHLPPQLKRLREGEKLLIQQVAAYVPLLHLKDGQIG